MATPALKTNEPILLRDDSGPVARLTLNRPEARNALSVSLMSALQEALDAIACDDAVRVVVVAANGPAFCAGHDMRELRADPRREMYEALFAQCSRLMTTILRLPKPVIARVHGTATAAGCQLVATCDLAVASKNAQFATPGVNIGLFCSTPMVALTRAVSRKAAMEMLLTGDPIDAAQAQRLGLVNQVVDANALDTTVTELATKIASKSRHVVAIGKEAFYRQIELGVDDAYTYASAVMTRNMLAADAREGIDAFLAKRKPTWEDR
jgi:enoyl-CoA hydratase/carnithine racemase